MSFRIDARIDGTCRRLEVVDAETGHTRLTWEHRPKAGSSGRQRETEAVIDELFRRLFLLNTAQSLRRR